MSGAGPIHAGVAAAAAAPRRSRAGTKYRGALITSFKGAEHFAPGSEARQKLEDLADAGAFDKVKLQLERAATGRLHWQIYVEAKTTRTMAWFKRVVSDVAAHVEKRKGSKLDAWNYCSKAESRVEPEVSYEYGGVPLPPQPGRRSDVLEVGEMVLKGADRGDILRAGIRDEKAGLVRAALAWGEKFRQIQAEMRMKERRQARFCMPRTVIWCGATGIGKTRYVYDNHDPLEIFRISCSKGDRFWRGYGAEEVVVFDEFRGQWSIEDMLQFLDGHPVSVPVLYGWGVLCAKHIYVLSNVCWLDWWPDATHEQLAAIRRRVREGGGGIYTPEERGDPQADGQRPAPLAQLRAGGGGGGGGEGGGGLGPYAGAGGADPGGAAGAAAAAAPGAGGGGRDRSSSIESEDLFEDEG